MQQKKCSHLLSQAVLLFFLLLETCLLNACGPREIGLPYEEEPATRDSIGAAEQMRYPLFGSSPNDRLLYEFNRTEAIRLRETQIKARLRGGNSSTETRIPQQRSPFLE